MASLVRRVLSRFTGPDPVAGRVWDDPELDVVLDEVRRGTLDGGIRLLAATRTDPQRRSMRLDALGRAAVAHVDELTRRSDADPQDPDLALWLGKALVLKAWSIRGAAQAKYVSRTAFEDFWLVLGSVAEPLERAARLLPDDPVPWDVLQWRGLGLEVDRVELDDLWARIVRLGPYFDGYLSRAQVLCAKWQGSNEELLDFATQVTANAPAGDPVAALAAVADLEIGFATQFRSHLRSRVVQERVAARADAWAAGPADHPQTALAHHLFGAVFFVGDDRERAARHLRLVDPARYPEGLPWGYLAESGRFYRYVRRELRLD